MSAELKIIISATDKASPSVKSLESSLAGLAKSVVSVYALKQGFDFLKDSVNKAALEEKNLRTLQTVIENQGESWDKVKGKVTSYITELERNTMFNDEQLIPSMKQLINAGMNTEQAMKSMNAVTDLATAKGIDLETSANLIGKAYMGNTDQLKRYGITATDFNDLMGKINQKFGGSAQKDMDTYAGSVKRLEQTIDANQKMIGNYWIPVLMKVNGLLDKVFGVDNTAKSQTEMAIEGIVNQIFELNKRIKNMPAPLSHWDMMFGSKEENDKKLGAYLKNIESLERAVKILQAKGRALKEQEKLENTVVLEQKKQEEDEYVNDTLDSEIWLNQQIEQAGKTLRASELEAEKIKNDELLQLAGASSQAITALGVATNSATLKGMGIVISGVQNAITAVNAMMTASGPVGFILGLLGFVTSVANTASSLNQLDELEKKNAALLQTGNTGITTITNPEVVTSSGGGSTSNVSSVERASNPVYYNISNTYNLNAGAVLGDEFNITEAFKKLMTKYDEQKALTLSGA